MITSIEQFDKIWSSESGKTKQILEALTDESLHQEVGPEYRTLGRMAWHIVQSVVWSAKETKLGIDGPGDEVPVPKAVAEIRQTYERVADAIGKKVRETWQDSTLEIEDEIVGQKWKRGFTLYVLITHEIHHRAQMTVLMRQAGLKVPGIYGPSLEEWGQYGAPPPAI